MADTDKQKHVNDTRMACKYGAQCYQKNPAHLQKYKHPPLKRPGINTTNTQPNKKFKLDIEPKADAETSPLKIDSNTNTKLDQAKEDEPNVERELTPENQLKDVDKISEAAVDLGRTSENFDIKEFIKEKFLVEMPEDFYSFWEFCKAINEKCPQEVFKNVGLYLIGPYDVLAGKFCDVPEQSSDNYLTHCRYYYDPPECQTVLKGDDKTGYHIGYCRDSPKEPPVFLVNNLAKIDGVFNIMGDNIFAAVYLYLEDLKKSGDPFKKIHIAKLQSLIKKKSEELQLSLNQKTQKIRDRDKRIVTRGFNKIGIVVPYNRKTQVGYRNLGVSNKELKKLLDDIQNALPDQKQKYLSDLQDILTNVSIATDECDFGTGIELGLNILSHGVKSLNQTISRLLTTNYKLISRGEFAEIAEAHMKNRKESNLSIV